MRQTSLKDSLLLLVFHLFLNTPFMIFKLITMNTEDVVKCTDSVLRCEDKN